MSPRVVSLTPAVFHLPERVNAVSRTYGDAPIVPRGPRLAPLLAAVKSEVVRLLDAPHFTPLLLTGTGSTAMAATLASCLDPKEKLLIVRNGAYGDRLLAYAKTLGQPFIDLDLAYGERPPLDKIEGILSRGEADAVAMVHGGTSTCTLNPVAEVGALTKTYGKKFLVDGVSALFVEKMDLEGWNIQAVMGSCNKGLHSQPNLTMVLVRDDLLGALKSLPQRAPSLELAKYADAQKNGSHPYTIDPLSLCQVKAALEQLDAEGGVAGRNAIYQSRCRLLREGYEKLGLEIARFGDMPLSSIGTALHIPKTTSYDAMAERLSTDVIDGHTFEIYAAQGKLSDKLFRIFHMGEYELSVYEVFLRALARVV